MSPPSGSSGHDAHGAHGHGHHAHGAAGHAHDAHDDHPRESPSAGARAHNHGHAHAHAPASMGLAFGLGVALNLGIVIGEVVVGASSHSVALFADAGHNFGDVLGLALSGGAAWLAKRQPSTERTYGYRRATVLSALANAVLLLVTTGGLAWESMRRLLEPEATRAPAVIAMALVGALVNAGSALLFFRERDHDLNVRGAFLHLAGDAAIAVGVALSAAVAWKTGWLWVDPVTGLLVALLILTSTWSLLRSSLRLVLDAVPEGVDLEGVRTYLADLPRVLEVHDLHIWAMSTTETALTAHLVMPSNPADPHFLSEVCWVLQHRFGIPHATLQVDPADAPEACRLAARETV